MALPLKVEEAFDLLQREIYLITEKKFSLDKEVEMYGELSAELFTLRDKYREFFGKKEKPASAAATADTGTRFTQNKPILTIAHCEPLVKIEHCTFKIVLQRRRKEHEAACNGDPEF